MPKQTLLDTHEKALRINLDSATFGSFAEIGAGQEVARWFLRVGAASGTVAKTVSAYDKEVSDDLYGAGSRYVSRQRLEAMLDREWKQLQTQLSNSRGAATRFFAFADTIAARNYAGTNECHGWMGIRFQIKPGAVANDVLLHVNLMDNSNLLQQEASGMLGVNLVYAVFHQNQTPDELLEGLVEGLSSRIEIDLIALNGPVFGGWNQRQLQIQLVTGGLAEAVLFSPDGSMAPPTEIVRKKSIALVPGTFHHVEPIHRQMLDDAIRILKTECGDSSTMGLFSLSTTPWKEGEQPADSLELLHRTDELLARSAAVLITKRKEVYQTINYLKRYTKASLRAVLGLPTLIRVIGDAYEDLEGRTLEGVARLFAQNIRIYAYSTQAEFFHKQAANLSSDWTIQEKQGMIAADQIRPRNPLGYLYDYLLACEFIVPLTPS